MSEPLNTDLDWSDLLTTEQRQQLAQCLAPGTKLLLFFNEGNPNNKGIEIRGIIDNRIIYRTWFKRKQYWHYAIEGLYMFELWTRDGHLSKRR
jgi:hypothetical protein